MNSSSYIHHSKSNSEVESLKEILPIYLDDFIKDFSFQDICDYVNRDYQIFTEEELNRIKSLHDEKQQIILMFFILIDNNKNIEKFLDVLRTDFKWLTNKIYQSMYNEKDLIKQYLDIVHNLKSNFPKHSDFNIHRLKYYSLIREELKKLKPTHYLVIYGELGIGKKWLAIDGCCDYSVVKSMGFNIFWLDVHDCNSQEKDIEKLQRLKILLGEKSFQKKVGDYEGLSNKILELQQDLRTILKKDEYKDCLLVLSNVQNIKTLKTFDLFCKILIITRNKAITERLSAKLTKCIHISDGLTYFECVQLFEKILGSKSNKFPDNYNDLFVKSNRHPFLLNVIAQNLKNQSYSEWNKWINNLENFQICNNKLQNVIELSLNVLKPEEFELYKTLSIFNHSVKIPVKVLASLWDKTEKETEKILKKFDKFSLINIEMKDGIKVCIIHFLYYSYLQDCVQVDKIELNKKLIKSFNIENALNNRKELDLVNIPNHSYFYHYIGYHLRESQMIEFFPLLYLDFVFLEKKLRKTGLSNTIGDLKYFRKDITGNDEYKEELIDRLLEFLPNIEEMIYKSKDTCLLQYALMSGGIIRKEALRQAKKFPDKIWFFDNREHFRRRRQMIQLPDKPKIVKLVEPDTCLIVLENHILFMADLSLGYNIEPTKFTGHKSKIINIQIFNKNYLISCDINGEIRIWSIADERRRSLYRKQSIKRVINQINYTSNPRIREKECLQILINSSSWTSSSSLSSDPKHRIHTFYLEKVRLPPTSSSSSSSSLSTSNYMHLLYLIYGNGDIVIYKWNDFERKFQLEILPILKTDIPNIRYLLKLFNRYFFILNNCGSLKIIKITDGTSVCFSFKWPQDTDNPVNLHSFYHDQIFYIIIVFTRKILQLKLPQQSFEFIKGDLYTLYEIQNLNFNSKMVTNTNTNTNDGNNNNNNVIKCSTLSDDNKYLIIGTKCGIVVLNAIDKTELLRNSLSECIIGIDICSLDDDIYKYIIVTGIENQKLLNIFGLKLNGNESITWANSVGTLCNDEFEDEHDENGNGNGNGNGSENTISSLVVDKKITTPQFEPNTWLLNGKFLFDVNFMDDKRMSLVAVDSKNRIHQLINNDWTMTVPGQLNCNITAITSYSDDYYIGCNNGDVYMNSSEEKLQNCHLNRTITYMKLLQKNLLTISTEKSSAVYWNKNVYNCDIVINESYQYNERYLILLNENSSFIILDLFKNCSIVNKYDDIKDTLGGSDFKSNTFVIATRNGEFYVYKFRIDDNNDLKIQRSYKHERQKFDNGMNTNININQDQMIITAIALSLDAGLCAVGFDNGCIEIYKVDKPWKYLQILDSHLTKIYDLKFSPWTAELNMPIILVSCAEQLCFWNITYILNNPIDEFNSGYLRRSSRYNSTNTATNNHDNDKNAQKIKSISLNNLSNILNSSISSPSPLSSSSSSSSSSSAPNTPNSVTSSSSSSSSSPSSSVSKQKIKNIWSNKKGISSNKPELISCIKFIGNKAEKFYTNADFTEFITIDDEGEFYYLIIQNLYDNNINNNSNLIEKINGNDIELIENDRYTNDDDMKIIERYNGINADANIDNDEIII